MREPFWRKQTQYWYYEDGGKQIRLSKLGEQDPDGATRKNPPKAVQDEWHRRVREGTPDDMRLGDLIQAFVASLPQDTDNHKTSRLQLARFERFMGKDSKVSTLKPNDLTRFIAKHPHWKPSTVRTFVNRIHASINWGVREGFLTANPISSTPGYKRQGRYERRKGVLSNDDRAKAEGYADDVFRPVLVALRETGCRPSEVCRMKVEKVNLAESYVLVPNKTAHLTGIAERKIYLSPEAKETVIKAIGERTEGCVFLNKHGKRWTIQSLKKRWDTLRAATGVKGSLRSYRRTFISSAINNANVNPALVATLAGHNIDIMMKHYFEADPTAMLKAVAAITSPPPSAPPETAEGPQGRSESSRVSPSRRRGSASAFVRRKADK